MKKKLLLFLLILLIAKPTIPETNIKNISLGANGITAMFGAYISYLASKMLVNRYVIKRNKYIDNYFLISEINRDGMINHEKEPKIIYPGFVLPFSIIAMYHSLTGSNNSKLGLFIGGTTSIYGLIWTYLSLKEACSDKPMKGIFSSFNREWYDVSIKKDAPILTALTGFATFLSGLFGLYNFK